MDIKKIVGDTELDLSSLKRYYISACKLDKINVDAIDDAINEVLTCKLPFGNLSKILPKLNLKEKYKILEEYWVVKPFAKVAIVENPVGQKIYMVIEPPLSRDEREFLNDLKELVIRHILMSGMNGHRREKVVEDALDEVIKKFKLKNLEDEKELKAKMLYYLQRDIIGYGKIHVMMHDPKVEDISCSGAGLPVYVNIFGVGYLPSNVMFTEEELMMFVQRLAQMCGKHISTANPIMDGTLPNGDRVNATLGEVSTKGCSFTIRRFKEFLISPVDLIRWGTFSSEQIAYLWLAIECGANILVVGGTASGKTTTLNALALFIPLNAKIVSIEDTREIRLPHNNWTPEVTRDSFTDDGKGRVDMFDLLKASLRQRPEYILLGEVRGKEAQTLFQAMGTGHYTLSTFHADSVVTAIHRLEYPPLSVPRTQIIHLNIVVVQGVLFEDGLKKRRNLEITEIEGLDPKSKTIRTITIFKYDPALRRHVRVIMSWDLSPKLHTIMEMKNWSPSDLEYHLEIRKKVLETLVKLGASTKEFLDLMGIYHAEGVLALERFLSRFGR